MIDELPRFYAGLEAPVSTIDIRTTTQGGSNDKNPSSLCGQENTQRHIALKEGAVLRPNQSNSPIPGRASTLCNPNLAYTYFDAYYQPRARCGDGKQWTIIRRFAVHAGKWPKERQVKGCRSSRNQLLRQGYADLSTQMRRLRDCIAVVNLKC